jgi:hypothetical protein
MNMEDGQTLGEWLAPALEQIEETLWSYELYVPNTPPMYSHSSFRAILKLFMSAMMDKIWLLQEGEEMDVEDRMAMVEKCGQELKQLVKIYTNIESEELYGGE